MSATRLEIEFLPSDGDAEDLREEGKQGSEREAILERDGELTFRTTIGSSCPGPGLVMLFDGSFATVSEWADMLLNPENRVH